MTARVTATPAVSSPSTASPCLTSPAHPLTTTATTTATSSGKKRKVVCVHLLNGTQLAVYVDVKAKFQEVFNQVVGHLNLRETEYFGLAFIKDNEYHFIALDEKIHKLSPKLWKSGSGEGLDSQGQAITNVWFRVQFYVDQVVLLREKVTRHQYYLQLKDNVLQYNLLYNQDKCFCLAAYALQADWGHQTADTFHHGYFNPCLYFPSWMIERHGKDYLVKSTPAIHRDLANMTRNEAELRYIRHATTHPGAHNLHFYTVRKRKTDKECNTWLAVGANGVDVFEDDAGYKNHISTFLWKDIGKLYFDKKRFEIRSVQTAGGRRFVYYTDCDVKSKYLLTICRSTHMFQMALQTKLMEIQHLDQEDLKRCRESYHSSDSRDNQGHFRHSGHSPSSSTNDQRFSVISDTSSNTTSGIVSDKLAASFDDGDDHSREIMIDCPPRSMVCDTPTQRSSKLLLLSHGYTFKHSPQSSKSSPSLLPQPLDFAFSPSPQELSPTSSNGSWRAKHSQFPTGCGKGGHLPLPSPTGLSHDASVLYGLRRSVGRKESFNKQFLLSSLDKNTSGDSAVSVSGSEKVSPSSLPQPVPGPSAVCGARLSGGNSPNVPLLLNHLQKRPSPSPPTTLTFTPATPGEKPSPFLHTTHSFSKHQDLLETRDSSRQGTNSPRGMHHHYRSMTSPRDLAHASTPRLAGLEPVSPKDNDNEHVYWPVEATPHQQLDKWQVSHGFQDLRPPSAQLFHHLNNSQTIPRHPNSQTIPRHPNSQTIPRHPKSQTIPRHPNSQRVPHHSSSQTVPHHFGSQTAPHYLDSQTAPHHFDSQTAPHYLDSQTAPHHFDSQTAPHHLDSQTVPHYLDSQTVPHHLDSQTVPHYLDSQTAPHHFDSQTVPHHLDSQTAPHYLDSQTVPHYLDSQTVPHYLDGQTAPHHFDSQTAPQYLDSQTAPHYLDGQTAPHHLDSQTVPQYLDSQTAPHHLDSQTVPHYLDSQTVPHYLDGQTVPHYLDGQTVPHYLDSQTAPHHLDSQTAPHHSNSQTAPHHLDSQTVPHHLDSQTVPHHSNSQTVPHHLDSQTVPHHSNSQTVPHHLDSQTVPHYLDSQTAPHYFDSQTVPHHLDSQTAPHYLDSQTAPHHFDSQTAPHHSNSQTAPCPRPQEGINVSDVDQSCHHSDCQTSIDVVTLPTYSQSQIVSASIRQYSLLPQHIPASAQQHVHQQTLHHRHASHPEHQQQQGHQQQQEQQQQQHQHGEPGPHPHNSGSKFSCKKSLPITDHYQLALKTSPHLSDRLSSPRVRPSQEVMDKINSHCHLPHPHTKDSHCHLPHPHTKDSHCHLPHPHTKEDYLQDQYRQYQLQQQEDLVGHQQGNGNVEMEENDFKEGLNTSHASQDSHTSHTSQDSHSSHTSHGSHTSSHRPPVRSREGDPEQDHSRDGVGGLSDSRPRLHPKPVLHPELKEILGQSQAISLPLITALCNDSTLMQTSRSTMSGSRSSYDTSTIRSTDSRLTRYSHDTDPRRWSSCGQTPRLASQSSRPYSWHSQHFDLPPTNPVNPTPTNPRSLKNKHVKVLENVSNVPQKMIESDPGPSSPRMTSNSNQVSWWDYPHSINGSTTSWANVIPYSLPSQLNKHCNSCGCVSSQHSTSHQHIMVPHKLSSGGHRDSDSSLTHQQMMKENIGLA